MLVCNGCEPDTGSTNLKDRSGSGVLSLATDDSSRSSSLARHRRQPARQRPFNLANVTGSNGRGPEVGRSGLADFPLNVSYLRPSADVGPFNVSSGVELETVVQRGACDAYCHHDQ